MIVIFDCCNTGGGAINGEGERRKVHGAGLEDGGRKSETG